VNAVTISWVTASVLEATEESAGVAAAQGFYIEVMGPDTDRVVQVLAPAQDSEVLGLRNGVEYSFRVFAATADGSSAPSEWVQARPTTGADGVVAGVIVGFAENVQVAPGAQSVPGDDRVGVVDLSVAERVSDDAILVEFSEPVDLETAERIASDLAADELVEWAEPDQFFFTATGTTSTVQESDWNLSGMYGVDATIIEDHATAGEGVTVAVIDTGITDHPDLQSRLVSGYDFVSSPDQLMASRQPNAPPVAFDADYTDTNTFGEIGRDANPADPGDWRETSPARSSSWHGTKMAGLISDVAPGASIQPIRALSWRGGLLSDIAASISWASGGTIDGVPANSAPAKVINMSFAVETTCPTALQQVIDAARENGSILIAAAGNANDDAAKYAPGNCNGVITVGSTTSTGVRADYSNYGATVDIAAPGGDATAPVLAVSNTGTTASDQPIRTGDYGTSVSAAHISAGAAVLAARNTAINPDEAYVVLTGRDFVKNFANPTCDANPDYSCGTGILTLAQSAIGTPARLAITGSASQTAGGSQTITVTAFDSAGNVATDYTGVKSLTFSGPASSSSPMMPPTVATTAMGTSTSLTFTNGVATASMILYKAESATVSVTDESISSSGLDRLTVTVVADTASKLTVGTQPVPAASGSALSTQPVVNVVDA
jgi:serine protease